MLKPFQLGEKDTIYLFLYFIRLILIFFNQINVAQEYCLQQRDINILNKVGLICTLLKKSSNFNSD